MTLQQIIEETVKEFENGEFRVYDTYNDKFVELVDLPVFDELKSFLSSAITKSVERVLEEVKIPEDEYCLCDQCKSCGRNYAVACVRQQQKYKSLMGKE